MSTFEDEDEHRPAMSDLLLFHEHFAGVASPYATHVYAHLLRLCIEEDDFALYTSAYLLSQHANITGLRATQAVEELAYYGAVATWDREDYTLRSRLWIAIEEPSQWRKPEDCPPQEKGFLSDVYVLKHDTEYKIGYSGQWQTRVRTVGRELSHRWSVEHVIISDQGRKLESFWHACFHHLRTRREWFALGKPELLWMKRTGRILYRLPHLQAELRLQAHAYLSRFHPEAIVPEMWNLSTDERAYCDLISVDIWG